jgi:hypothetical protein
MMNLEKLEKDSNLINKLIISNSNFFVGRLGSVEAQLLGRYGDLLLRQNEGFSIKDSLRLRMQAKLNAGIWPPCKKILDEFASLYQESLKSLTHIGVWSDKKALPNENLVVRNFCPQAHKLGLTSLDPVTLAGNGVKPWSLAMEGKKVLIISSFSEEINSQFKFYSELHSLKILPNMEIYTIKPPLSNGLQFSSRTWSQKLNRYSDLLLKKVQAYKPDLALISAGSYGLPIGRNLLNNGVSSIYIGGALQILFGIWGERWRENTTIQKIATDRWINPFPTSRPKGFKFIENGTYW